MLGDTGGTAYRPSPNPGVAGEALSLPTPGGIGGGLLRPSTSITKKKKAGLLW